MNKHQQLRPTTNAFKKTSVTVIETIFSIFSHLYTLRSKKMAQILQKIRWVRVHINQYVGFCAGFTFQLLFPGFPSKSAWSLSPFCTRRCLEKSIPNFQTVSRQVTVQNSCKSKSESRGIRASESHGFPRCEWWLLIEEDLPGKKNIHFCFADYEWWCYFKPNNSSSIVC